jgi:hypothetical protein
MYGSGLGGVFESMHGRQLSIAPQWIRRITMRISGADNRAIIPLGYSIQQAHQTGMWDEGADFRFVNRHVDGLQTPHASGF